MKEQSIDQYLTALSSRSSTPGGGAVAAVTGAQAAALIAMVCNFSKAADIAEIDNILQRAKQAQVQFISLGEADVTAFKAVMAAYKLPKKSEPEKKFQTDALQLALRTAAEAPLETLILAQSLTADIARLAEIGNQNLLTDIGIAAILVPATVRSAEMNIRINLSAMKDPSFIDTANKKIQASKICVQDMTNLATTINAAL